MARGLPLNAVGYIVGIIIVVILAETLIPPSPAKTHQVIAVTAFLGTILGAIFYWQYRVAFALLMISLMLFTGTMSVEHMIEHMHMDVIAFLIGMMIIIGFLEERGFFEYLLNTLIRPLARSGASLFAGILVLAAFMASLVDEVTSILFILALLLRITKKYDLDIIPFMIAAVIATNVGSSFTVVGNPIGVLIALSGGFTFMDFINHAFLSVGLWVLLLTVGLSLLYWRDYVRLLDERMRERGVEFGSEEVEAGSMTVPWLVFLATIGGLVVHHQVEHALHLPKNSMLVGVPLLMASIALFLSGGKAREIVEQKVEWWSLVFFMFFFATVGGIAETGVARLMASAILNLAHGSPVLIMLLALWASGLLSAFMDNVLAVATFITILQALEPQLGATAVLPAWWAILFGGCYGGNMTMIGSTANIVAIGVVEKARRRYIRFVDWLKPGVLLMMSQMILSSLLVYLRYFVLHIY
jgi:Na+/H+ antiporter NhaD/arsenite permease-like protein